MYEIYHKNEIFQSHIENIREAQIIVMKALNLRLRREEITEQEFIANVENILKDIVIIGVDHSGFEIRES